MKKGQTVRLQYYGRWNTMCKRIRICNNCGQRSEYGYFCWNCGNDIRETTKIIEVNKKGEE